MDKNFDIKMTETTIELAYFDLKGHPPLQSIANCRRYLLTRLPIATHWGTTYQAQCRLLQSGGLGVQYVQSMRTLEISIVANDRPSPSLHRAVALGDDMLNFGHFQTYQVVSKITMVLSYTS